jgi:TDG/mug DNA glycosylase family protein
VPEPITYVDDRRLTEFGFGITNLIARPTPGIDTLSPAEYVAGWKVLERKIKKFKPAVVALVGVTVWRAIVPLLDVDEETRTALRKSPCPGPQPVTVHGARIHVLPNPSGRNANFSYVEMLEAFRVLKSAGE